MRSAKRWRALPPTGWRRLAEETDRDNQFPMHLWQEMGALGLLGMTADPDFGGTGMGYLAHVVAMEEISRASASVGLSYGAHSNLCVNQINRWGNEAQKAEIPAQAVLRRACRGAGHERAGVWLGCGVDEVARRKAQRPLRAQRQQDVDHQRAGRQHAGGLCQDRSGRRSRGITAFLIEKGMAGFSTAQKLDKLGMRGSNTCELVFEDCEVPFENVLGEEGQGAKS
jgi:isovaleryl-CoA dehydrogenase